MSAEKSHENAEEQQSTVSKKNDNTPTRTLNLNQEIFSANKGPGNAVVTPTSLFLSNKSNSSNQK